MPSRRSRAGRSEPPTICISIVTADGRGEYDVRDLLACIVDEGSLQEYQARNTASAVLTAYRPHRRPAGGHRRQPSAAVRSESGELQIGGVIYDDTADKAARFVMDCNQTSLPIVFFQDVQGFMVGKRRRAVGHHPQRRQAGERGQQRVVPKITVIVGGSFGAGNYALCGKAFDPASSSPGRRRGTP